MPPYLAPPYFSLSRLPITTKIGLTCFYLMILGALAFTGFVVFEERTGYDADRAHENFRGNEWRYEQGESPAQPIAEKSPRQRTDIIHPHSFLMPILFFILVHLMEMTRAPRGLKILLYVTAFASTVVVIAAPYLVYESRAWAGVLIAAAIGQLATYALMILAPMGEMWLRRSPTPTDTAATPKC